MAKMGKIDLSSFFADVSNSDTPQVTMIDVDRITDNAANFYRVDADELRELMDSIALSGVLDPPTVTAAEDGTYRLISGHRRTAAVRALIDEGREDLRLMPCFVRSPRSAAMEELELIMANSTARRLTSGEQMEQAARVKRLLYELAEQGVEFPGRMRDHVAEACQLTKTKLANLEFIDKHLPASFRPAFKAGALADSTALELSHLPEDLQQRLEALALEKPADIIRDNVKRIADHADWYRQPSCTCPDGSVCTHADGMLRRTAAAPNSWTHCWETCCCKCSTPCKYACPISKAQRKDDAAREKIAHEKAEQKRQEKAAAEKSRLEAEADDFYERLMPLVEARRVDLDVLLTCLGTPIWKMPQARKVATGEPSANVDMYTFPSATIKIVRDTCALLGASADYIFGVADDPHPAQAAEWQTGPLPPRRCLAAIFDGGDGYDIPPRIIYTDINGRATFDAAHRLSCGDVPILRWLPLPGEKEDT